jgi:hypothetical protein
MAGTATMTSGPAAANGSSTKQQLYPFLFGTQEQRVPIATIPVTPGLKAATVRIPKNGYLCKMIYRFVGSATVGTVGTAGTPNLFNLLANVALSYNGGFLYRQVDGESLYVMNCARRAGSFGVAGATGPNTNPVTGGRAYANYVPTAAATTAVGFVIEDDIALNSQVNADRYLLAAQARNADITLDVTFGSLASVYANTEVLSSLTGTLYVEGLYLLDPDYTKFAQPDLTRVQQIITDTSFTSLTIGDNTVPVVPVNGPKYLQLFFKIQCNGVPDPGGLASYTTRVQLKINNGLNRYDMSPQALQQENDAQLGRNSALPTGWYMLDFLDDASINNAVSMVGRNVISTEKIANLWLVTTLATGTNLTANNLIKLIKRVEMPAIG